MTHSLKANFKSTSHGKTHRGTLTDGVRLQTGRNSSDVANVRSPGGPGPGRDEPVQSHPVRRSGCGLGRRDLPEVSDARRPGRTRGPSEPLASGTAQRRKCGQRAFGPRGAAIPGPCSSPLPWGCPLCCRLREQARPALAPAVRVPSRATRRTYIFMYRCTSAGSEDPSKTKSSTITFSVSLGLQWETGSSRALVGLLSASLCC